MVEAINQAVCTECDDAEFSQTARSYQAAESNDENAKIQYDASCDSCGAEMSLTITENGVTLSGDATHKDASWKSKT